MCSLAHVLASLALGGARKKKNLLEKRRALMRACFARGPCSDACSLRAGGRAPARARFVTLAVPPCSDMFSLRNPRRAAVL
jgi:hypothetical protein